MTCVQSFFAWLVTAGVASHRPSHWSQVRCVMRLLVACPGLSGISRPPSYLVFLLHTLYRLWLVTTSCPQCFTVKTAASWGGASCGQRARRRGWVALADLLQLVSIFIPENGAPQLRASKMSPSG